MIQDLIKKYDVPGPRYTSYPTVPYWQNEVPDQQMWLDHVSDAFDASNEQEGISIYIHLPFCESLCTYCGCTTRITVNHLVEEPYITSVLNEWRIYRAALKGKPRIKELHLGGGTPTFFRPANLKRLVSSIMADCELAPGGEMSFECHPGCTTEEHLSTLYDIGFRRISIGIQDFDPVVQQTINRKQTLEQVQSVHNTAREIGYTSINHDLIFGLPKQTEATIEDSMAKVAAMGPDRIAFYSYAHVPWMKPAQRSFKEEDLPTGKAKRKLYDLGLKLLTENGFEEVGMDHFALPGDALLKAKNNGSLYRNFMGYTPSQNHLLIGLGVSSISDSWSAFAQNVKTVEQYQQLADAGQLPMFRGHFLTAEDLILRQHILNIMCRYQTSWLDENLQSTAIADAVIRLSEMQEDGLVEITGSGLKVTTAGMPFLRNIAMAFDARLWARNVQSDMFSRTV